MLSTETAKKHKAISRNGRTNEQEDDRGKSERERERYSCISLGYLQKGVQ